MSPLLPLLPNLRNRSKGFGLGLKFPNSFRKMMPLPAPELKRLRRSAVVLGVSNALIIIMGILIVIVAHSTCGENDGTSPVMVMIMVSFIRIGAMIGTGIAQQHTASSILTSQTDLPDSQIAIRQQRRVFFNPFLFHDVHYGTFLYYMEVFYRMKRVDFSYSWRQY